MNHDIKYSIVDSPAVNRQIVAIEPLERGFGHTLGAALRRVMLSHLTGAAVTRIKIDGVQHEFSPLQGVHEDVVQFIQNLKLVDFKMSQKKTTIVTIEATGDTEVTAGDIKCPTGIEVVNKDLHLATLSDKKSVFKAEITVDYGQGYELPDDQEKKPVGVVLIDANYSPIVLVSYTVDTTRVGRVTDLDRLVMDVTTNGSISPKEAVQQASAIMVEYFAMLAGDTEVYTAKEIVEEPAEARKSEKSTYLEELSLPTRVLNTLKKAGFETADEVKEAGEDGLSNVKNIGPKTVKMLLKKIDDAILNRG